MRRAAGPLSWTIAMRTPSSSSTSSVGSSATTAGSSTLPWTACTGGPSARISASIAGGAHVAGVQDRVGAAQQLDAAVRQPALPSRQVRVGDDREPRHRSAGSAIFPSTTWSAAPRTPGAHGLAGRDERRVPRVAQRRRVPVVEVDPLQADADRQQVVDEPLRGLRGVRRRLAQAHLVLARLGPVAPVDEPADLGQPDVALHRAQQSPGPARAEPVDVDVVVQTPHRRLACRRSAGTRGPS